MYSIIRLRLRPDQEITALYYAYSILEYDKLFQKYLTLNSSFMRDETRFGAVPANIISATRARYSLDLINLAIRRCIYANTTGKQVRISGKNK